MGKEQGGGVVVAPFEDRGPASSSICCVMSPRSALRTACMEGQGHRARSVAH